MKKFTRRSYNRKLIVFALSIFMAVSLVSVGFSAWVMSAVSNADADSPVNVGIVSDASLTVTVDQWTKEDGEENFTWKGDKLSFDAPAGDTGRVRADDDAVENLSMVISGKVTNAATLKSLVMTITLPAELGNAIQAGYISVKDAEVTAGNQIVIGNADGTDKETALNYVLDNETGIATFSYTLTFEWGAFFGGENPAVFYDGTTTAERTTIGEDDVPVTEAVAGNAILDEQMKTEMATFRSVMTGGLESDATYEGQIDIQVAATVN